MHKHSCISILLMVAAFAASCTHSQTGVQSDAPKPPTVTKQPSTASARLIVQVAEDGTPSSVKVQKSSGLSELDQHMVDQILKKWRWPAGKARTYVVPMQFKQQ